MRVISGKYKGKNLIGIDIEGTRPTMDRVKESMFAMIQDYVKDSVVLDLFAGSGSLGIEALSNGAKECYFVDKNKLSIDAIKKNTQDINNKKIIFNDSFKALKEFNIKFDLILLDPPYHLNLMNKALKKIKEYDLLSEDGIIVCEVEENINTDYKIIKEKKYGNKKVIVLKQ